MIFAKRVFWTAGLYGLLVTAPQLFMEAATSREFPPAVTHPEFYYGFVGAVLAWQVVFLLIGSDPGRYRPLMLVALIEKGVFGAAVPVLFVQGRVPALLLVFAAIDLALAALFVLAWRRTRPEPAAASAVPTRRYTAEPRPVDHGHDTEVLLHDLDRAMDIAAEPPSSRRFPPPG